MKENLIAGLRLAPSKSFSAGFDQAAALVPVSLAVIVVLSFPYGADGVSVDWNGISSWAAIALALTVLVLVVARMHGEPAIAYATQLLSSAPWFIALVLIVARLMPHAAWMHEFLILLGTAIVVIVAVRSFRQTAAAAVVLLLAAAILIANVDWYRFYPPAVFYGVNYDDSDRFPDIDFERLYRDQPRLVGAALDSLLPQRPGQADIYFVGFAGNADEPVFGRDLSWVHRFFDEQLGTGGRSIALHATIDTIASEPLASRQNLADVLTGIGGIIDPNEDSVFLYLTSHGAEAGWIDVSLYPLQSQELSATDLRQALDDAGIRWRIIVISACFSGSFIDTLANDQTMIMTAAREDRSSFGCNFESEMTWFADALFRQSLAEGMGLIDAFANATRQIADREDKADFDRSEPQLYIGDAIRARLEGIDAAAGLMD